MAADHIDRNHSILRSNPGLDREVRLYWRLLKVPVSKPATDPHLVEPVEERNILWDAKRFIPSQGLNDPFCSLFESRPTLVTLVTRWKTKGIEGLVEDAPCLEVLPEDDPSVGISGELKEPSGNWVLFVLSPWSTSTKDAYSFNASACRRLIAEPQWLSSL
jgi:hypothetical protein